MNIIIISNYYYPEIGAAPNRITNLAEGLAVRNNKIDVICPLPNYPKGKIFTGYKSKFSVSEHNNSVNLKRYWIYSSVSKNAILRIVSMFSFAFSLWAFSFKRKKIKNTDWIIIQNSPLLVSFSAIILFKKTYKRKIALNVSDLWPLSALELGAIKKGKFYSFLEWIEKFNYKNSNMIIGQSQEILDHANKLVKKPSFLYRNLQINNNLDSNKICDNNFKIIYAGLLGVAQGVYDIIDAINFKLHGVELHIYGHGNEESKIKKFIADNTENGVVYKGSVSKEEIHNIIPSYNASLVPLKNRIKGAVPSKIFELIYLQVPVLFCGGGEGASIVKKHGTGLCSSPGDHKALFNNMLKLKGMENDEYNQIKLNCKKAAETSFNFDVQINNLNNRLINDK